MEVENSRAKMDYTKRGERALLSQPMPDVQINEQFVLSDLRIEPVENPSTSEVEEPAKSAGNQLTNRGDLDTVDIQSVEGDIDNDESHDTAVAVHYSILSLQRKVLKIVASVLVPAMELQGQSSAEPSLQGSTSEGASAGKSTSQHPPSTTQQRSSARNKNIVVEDRCYGSYEIPFERYQKFNVSTKILSSH